MSQPDTKTKILDAAEDLFARNGFHATSLRMITGQAGVNLAAVNYHFGSKEELLEAVIERRLAPLNRQRLALLEHELDRARREGRRPDPRELMRALIEPTIRLCDLGAGPERFITLVGRILAEPEGVGRDIFLRQMGPFVFRLFEALHQSLPGISRTLLFWRLHFAIGSLSHVMRCHDRHGQLPEGVEARLDTGRLSEILLAYTLAGMEAAE